MKFLKNNQALVALAAMYIIYVLIDVIFWKLSDLSKFIRAFVFSASRVIDS